MTTLLAKRALKRTAGLASVLLHRAMPVRPQPAACVLCYHRVSGVRVREWRLDDWCVSPEALDRQIASLRGDVEFVFVRDLCRRLRSAPLPRPLVCLTFDDGFQNFRDEVLPILQRHDAVATLFVVSAYVGSAAPMPFDKWGVRHQGNAPAAAWRAIDWRSLDECARSGLVEIGGHSHLHLNAAVTSADEVTNEAGDCRRLLTKQLGAEHAMSYAYPYGSTRLGQVPPAYVAAVRAAGYDVAVTTDLGVVTAATNRYCLPRVEVSRSDGPAVVGAKVRGSLAPYRFTDRLRRARR